MYCMHCGKSIDDGLRFCPLCGKKLASDDTVYLDDTGPVALDMGAYSANAAGAQPLDPTMAAFGQPAQTYQPPAQQAYQAPIQQPTSQPIYVQTAPGVASVIQPVIQPVPAAPAEPPAKKSKAPVIAGIAAALAGLAAAALIVFVVNPFGGNGADSTQSTGQSGSDSSQSVPAGTQEGNASSGTSDQAASGDAGAAATAQPVEYSYQVVQGKFTWSEAKAYCEKAGVSLACAHDADDWDKIVSAAADSGLRVLWTGGYKGTDGKWHWTDDGSELTFTAWASGEPNNEYGVENRVALLYARDAWNMFDTPDDMGSTYKAERMGLIMQVPW